MHELFTRYKNSLLAIFSVALVARLIVTAFLYREHINPILDHWRFGWEMGEVARSIYLGQGFSSPLFEPSGPTAWMAPIYPWIIAICFKLFGLHTVASAWAVCTFNSICGSLTAVVVYYVAKRTFGEAVAWISAWIWAVFPYSLYLSAGRIWENAMTTFLVSVLFLQALRIDEKPTRARWIAWGALWGFAALTSPAVLASLPFLGLWLAYRANRQRRSWFLNAVASALVFFAVMSPWVIRNQIVMNRFIPLRDNFWLEMHVGNNGDTSDVTPDSAHPSNNIVEREQWKQLGEIGYMEAKKIETIAFIKSHKAFTAWVTARRFLYTWTGFWSLSPGFLANEPFHIPNVLFTTSMTLLCFLGLRFGFQNGYGERLTPYVLMLISYPAVYYFTHPSMDYRHPIDMMIVILGCYGTKVWLEKRKEAKGKAMEVDAELATVQD